MTFPAGATVAIVGDVGCGASRLADLCLRLRDPEVGRITFDGLDVREVGLEALRGEVAVATADGVLLNGTIAENLRLAHPEATDSDLELATRLAGVHQAIVGLVKGYDTRLEDGGDRLPVLVRRRLSLARALLHDPSVLIADRLGEGLDPAAEAQLYGALERAGDGRLTLLITSRVRWASCADRIYVMERGRVVEQGMHDDLVRRDTLYARLWREQEDEASAGEATKRRAAYLQRVPTFAPLPPHLQDLIAEEMELQRLQQGDEIVRAGDVMDRLVVVQSGMIEVVASDPVLRGKTVARLYRGDCCGEMALLHDGLRGAGLRAGSPVELYTLRRVDFFRLLRRAPELEDRLRRVMAERTQISRRRESGRLSALQTVRLPQRAAG
jgi:CRP-like cAMP-binding protein/ABC-type branched-subunit amino acid transport system ATPase component